MQNAHFSLLLLLTGVLYDGGVGGPLSDLRVLRYLTRFLRVLSTYVVAILLWNVSQLVASYQSLSDVGL